MQTRFVQFTTTLDQYRAVIITMLVLALLIALFIMPSAVVEAGRAVSTGG